MRNRPSLSYRASSKLPAIVGYAATFYRSSDPGTQYRLWPGAYERVMPGAFASVFKRRDDVRGLFNHDPSKVLGRTRAATMTITVDSVGLRYVIEPADTTLYRDVAEMIRRGDVDGSSFGFRVLKEDWRLENGLEIRELLDVELLDVGPVTFPAYTAASSDLASRQAASARAIDQSQIDRERDQRELVLRKLQLARLRRSADDHIDRQT